jgi:hypothetical protein
MHVHVYSADGEAKFWLEPSIELAESHGIASHGLRTIARIIERRADEITSAWHEHFGS